MIGLSVIEKVADAVSAAVVVIVFDDVIGYAECLFDLVDDFRFVYAAVYVDYRAFIGLVPNHAPSRVVDIIAVFEVILPQPVMPVRIIQLVRLHPAFLHRQSVVDQGFIYVEKGADHFTILMKFFNNLCFIYSAINGKYFFLNSL